MFEKEAKEHSNETLCSVCENPTCTEDLRCREWRDRRAGFYCGAKFGYNKTKEELKKANEWHYVKKELPKESKKYYIYSEEWGVEVKKFIADVGCFECRNNNVIAWKEIVLPELPKESE